MLNKSQKEKIVEEVADKFKRQKIAVFTDFHGVSVAKSQSLRRLLKEIHAEYKVAKKTLLDRALEKAGIGIKTKELQGELGIAFGYGDAVAMAKSLVKFGKKNATFKILKGLLEGKILEGKEIVALAKLPSREILIAQFLGTLQAPMRGLVTILGGNIRNLVVVLHKIKDNKSA